MKKEGLQSKGDMSIKITVKDGQRKSLQFKDLQNGDVFSTEEDHNSFWMKHDINNNHNCINLANGVVSYCGTLVFVRKYNAELILERVN